MIKLSLTFVAPDPAAGKRIEDKRDGNRNRNRNRVENSWQRVAPLGQIRLVAWIRIRWGLIVCILQIYFCAAPIALATIYSQSYCNLCIRKTNRIAHIFIFSNRIY